MSHETQQFKGHFSTLREVATLFLWLGLTSFGGPAAHIALMQKEFVERRRWMSQAEFLDMLSVCHLLPGPTSTELALHVGFKRARWPGLVVAGVSFIVPAAACVLLLAWSYQRLGRITHLEPWFYFVKPVVFAIVCHALFSLSKSALNSLFKTCVAFGTFVVSLVAKVQSWSLLSGLTNSLDSAAQEPTALPIFTFFVKTGSLVFGSGYVLISFLYEGLVKNLKWISEQQLLDAIAVGQFTPGPVFTTAGFIGYLLSDVKGFAAACVGVFLPSFLLVSVSAPFVDKLQKQNAMRKAVDVINAVSVGLLAFAAFELAKVSLFDVQTTIVGAAAFWMLWRTQLNSAVLILAGFVLSAVWIGIF